MRRSRGAAVAGHLEPGSGSGRRVGERGPEIVGVVLAAIASLAAASVTTLVAVGPLDVHASNAAFVPLVAAAIVVAGGLFLERTRAGRVGPAGSTVEPSVLTPALALPDLHDRSGTVSVSVDPSLIDERGWLRLDAFPSLRAFDEPQCAACGAIGSAVEAGYECPECGVVVGAPEHDTTVLSSLASTVIEEEV